MESVDDLVVDPIIPMNAKGEPRELVPDRLLRNEEELLSALDIVVGVKSPLKIGISDLTDLVFAYNTGTTPGYFRIS